MPFEEYMHGFGSPDLAPLIGTRKLQTALERDAFVSVFLRAITTITVDAVPERQWKVALATRFDRGIYVFSVQTTPADDAVLFPMENTYRNIGFAPYWYFGGFREVALGAMITLPPSEGDWRATGLSRSQILDGDPRVATLVLAAVIDYHLHQSESRRENIEYVDGLFTLSWQASGAVARGTRGRPDDEGES